MPFPRSQTQIVGNLGRDAEMRYTPSGKAVTQFSVAVTVKFNNTGGEELKETTWYQVSAWGKTAEMTASLRKGQQVLVIGRLTPDKATGGPRIWTRQDGSAGSSFDLNATEVWLSLFAQNDAQPYYTNEGAQEAPPEDDIPF